MAGPVRLRSGLEYAFSARTSSRLEIDLENNDIREDRHSHRIAGVAIALSHAFEGGLSISPRISIQQRRHDGADPLFPKVRSDQLIRLSANPASPQTAGSRLRAPISATATR